MKTTNGKLLSGLIITLVLGSYGWTTLGWFNNRNRTDYIQERIESRLTDIDKKITEIFTMVKIYIKKYAK